MTEPSVARKQWSKESRQRSSESAIRRWATHYSPHPCKACGKNIQLKSKTFCNWACRIASKQFRVCENCHSSFSAPPSQFKANRRFCSQECFASSKVKTIACQECGKQFKSGKLHNRKAKFCSKQCSGLFNQRSKYPHTGQKIDINCAHCGRKFIVRPKYGERRYCSRDCSDTARLTEIGMLLIRVGTRNYAQLSCKQCRRLYYKIPAQVHRSSFCSRNCANAFLAESVRTGTRNPFSLKRTYYTDRLGRLFKFRSTWEKVLAEKLDSAKLAWDYEPLVLSLSNGQRYIPDFWVQELNRYLEVKAPCFSTAKVSVAVQDGHAIELIQDPNSWSYNG